MCINNKWITNKYTGQDIFVPCGKCASCQQEKAMRRVTRLRNSVTSDYISLFVTLTYDNTFIPYVRRQDVANKVFPLPVYRDKRQYYYYDRSLKSLVSKVINGTVCLDKISKVKYGRSIEEHSNLVNSLTDLKNTNQRYDKFTKDKISVIYYKDLQNFIKRLRQNVWRDYGIHSPIKVFMCSEYGPTTWRGHFHLLLFIPSAFDKEFRNSIVKSWPFADKDITRENIKFDFGAKHYVAAYVNRPTDYPSFLSSPAVRPKSSSSTNLGFDNDFFSLDKVLEAAAKRDLRYHREVKIDRVPTPVVSPIPQYVINRYFPPFKGLSRLPLDTYGINLYDFLINPTKVGYTEVCKIDGKFYTKEFFKNFPFLPHNDDIFDYEPNISNGASLHPAKLGDRDFFRPLMDFFNWTPLELYNIEIRLKNAARKYGYADSGYLDIHGYAHDYCQTYLAKKMTTLKSWYEDMQLTPLNECYDNIEVIFTSSRPNQSLVCEYVLKPFNLNPNAYGKRSLMTDYYSRLFQENLKKRKSTNYCMSKNGHLV